MIFIPVLSANVTLDVRASSLKDAIPRIGAAFGVPMRAAPSIGEEIGIFSLRGASLDGFKAWSATTLRGEWSVDRDGTLVLNRSSRLREAESKEFETKRIARVHAWRTHHAETSALTTALDPAEAKRLRTEIGAWLAKPRKPEDQNAAYYRQYSAYQDRLPGGRLFARVLAVMPDVAFAGSAVPERIVYSSRPVGRQLPLPFDPAPILRAYATEANVWADATANLPPSGTEGDSRIPTVLGRRQEPVGAVPILVVSVNVNYGLGAPEIAVYDESGRRVVRQTGYVGDSDYQDQSERRAQAQATKFPLVLAPESKAFAAAHFPPDNSPPNPAAVRPFLDVERRDPLSYGASDGLFALARAKGKNLISRGDDDLVWVFRQREDGDSNLQILNYFGLLLKEEGDWIAVIPDNPDFAAAKSLPRPILGRMLRIADETGLTTLEDLGAVARLYPDCAQNYELSKVYGEVFPYWPQYEIGELAIYGSLTEAERRRAKSADGLPVSAVNREVRALLERFLFMRREFYFHSPNPADEPLREAVQASVATEPTIVLANGFPPEARIQLKDETVQSIRYGEGRWTSVLTPDEIALAMDRTAHPGFYPGEDTDPLPTEGLIPVTERRLTMEIRTSRLTSAVERTFTSEVRVPGGPYTAATLPAPQREAIARAVAALAERNRNRGPAPEPKGQGAPPTR